ncbi:MAG: 50S ribosomal protein L24 [Geminicoccaceae bacterium]
MAAKVRKGDRVVVTTGRDKGKQGEVLRVLPQENRVVVQGVMIARRHQKAGPRNPEGGIVAMEAPIAVSNVAHLDPKDGKPTRVGFKSLDDGRKVRFAKRSGEIIDR